MKTVLLLSVLLSSLVLGQNQPVPKLLRLIPLGQNPVWKEKLKDNVRVGDAPPAGSLPPTEVTLPSGKKDGVQTAPLQLGVMSKTLRLDARIPSLQFHEGKLAAGEPWLKAPVHKSTRSLGVLFRDPTEMTWEKPRILLLDDSEEAFPPGNIRFVNTAGHTALVQIGKTANAVKPGESRMLPLKVGDNVIMVGYQERGTGKQVVINKALTVRIMANQRVQAFFYQNQNKAADKQLLFQSLPEPPPAL
ncbi:hypothetical protein V2O64_20075 [Verrucomicrobiaceae bacterium 227]